VKTNVEHVRSSEIEFDVTLAHYQGSRSDWNREWYDRNVHHSLTGRGYKFHFLQEAFKGDAAQFKKYEYVWALDSDVDISQANLQQLLEIGRETGSRVVGPTFVRNSHRAAAYLLEDGEVRVESGSDISAKKHQMELWKLVNDPRSLQIPNAACDYRHTDFVELTAPLIRSDVLATLLLDCQDCIGRNSDWGLDMMWCNYLSEKTRSRACALIDKSPVVHLDWMLAKVNEQFFSSLQAVRAAYGKYFSHKKTLTCMHQTSGQSPVGHVAWQRNDTGASRETKMPDQHKDVPPPQTVKVNKNSTKTAKMDQERQTPATPKQGILRREVVHPQEANPTRKVAARVMLQNPGS